MTDTPNIRLPLIAAAQSQKHVTHNEALMVLDGVVQLAVADKDLAAPPADPVDGDRYIVAAGATGDWSGWDGSVAYADKGAWTRLIPEEGWSAFVRDEGKVYIFKGAAWEAFGALPASGAEIQNAALIGLGTTADETNPLAVKANNALFSARYESEEGDGDLRFKLNKEAADRTASQIYQSNWSGRAETGLIGDDHFRVKVSADGATWRDAIDVDPLTGAVSFPNTAMQAGLRNLLINARGLVNQRGYVSGTATAAAGRYTLDRWRVVAAGQALAWTEANGYRTFTAPAGGVEQVIEGVDVVAGTYVLTWTGTASASINGAAVAKGGTVSLAGGVNVTVRFSGGTFALPQLEHGTVPSAFEVRPFGQELIMCQRYFEKSYNLEVAPGTASQMGRRNQNTFQIATNHRADIPFRVIKRAAPTVTIYNPTTGAAGQVRAQPDADITIGGVYVPGGAGCMIDFVTTATTQAVYWHWVAEAEL